MFCKGIFAMYYCITNLYDSCTDCYVEYDTNITLGCIRISGRGVSAVNTSHVIQVVSKMYKAKNKLVKNLMKTIHVLLHV